MGKEGEMMRMIIWEKKVVLPHVTTLCSTREHNLLFKSFYTIKKLKITEGKNSKLVLFRIDVLHNEGSDSLHV
jgi:hypothetical protein